MHALYARLTSVGLAVFLAVGSAARADEAPAARDKPRQHDGLIARFLHLLPPAFAEELHLTAEQQTAIQDLDQQFKKDRREKLFATGMKVWTIVDGCAKEAEDAEPAPVLAIAHEITGCLLESRRSHISFEKKMLAHLNAEQKATFAHLKEHGLREHRAARFADRSADHGSLISTRLQDRLNLTAEQKKQIAELREEFHKKMRDLLTEDQRVRFEEFTSRPGRPPGIRDDTKRKREK